MAERRIEPNFSQGWGFALFIVLLAVACFATAGYIKSRTYRHPTDAIGGAEATKAEH
jgi:hypothetical protein